MPKHYVRKLYNFKCNILHFSTTRMTYPKETDTSIKNCESEFKCVICKRFFGVNSRLMKHIRAFHRNKKQFKCDICKTCFTLNPSKSP